jgi:hypothetical protein
VGRAIHILYLHAEFLIKDGIFRRTKLMDGCFKFQLSTGHHWHVKETIISSLFWSNDNITSMLIDLSTWNLPFWKCSLNPFGNALAFMFFQKRMKWPFGYKYWMFQNTWVPPFICGRTTSFQKQYFTAFLRVSTCETQNCTVHVLFFFLFFFFFQFVNFFNNFFLKKLV